MKVLIGLTLILSIIDIVATYLGISIGFIKEGNPVLQVYHKDPLLVSLVILIYLVVALYFISRVKRTWIKYVMNVVVFVKLCVVALHANWILSVI